MDSRVLAVAALLLLAGCAEAGVGRTPVDPGATTPGPGGETTADPTATDGGPGTGTGTDGTGTSAPGTGPGGDGARPDPATDRLGWEAGRWYDDPVRVTPADGYNGTELDRVLARTMARVERLRGLEFEETVGVELITRAEYRERAPTPGASAFDEQAYEALFLVGENGSVADALAAVYGGQVTGYYAGDEVVLVSDGGGPVQVSRETLAHELVHALQDQHEQLGFPRGRAESTDGRAAGLAVSEGDANYVDRLYERRCGTEWDCIPPVPRGGNASSLNFGVFLGQYVPYSEGPDLVAAVRERGGWEAVAGLYADPPASTEQAIHPGRYPGDRPVEVRVPDRSDREWTPVTPREGRTDTLGEANLYAMAYASGVVPEAHLRSDAHQYNYSHPVTDGWEGDALAAYRREGGDGEDYGYVFRTRWATDRDARQFLDAYRELLDGHGARRVRPGVYRVDSGPFADAFRVVRDGRTVTVVNAPTVAALDDVHAPE